MSGAGRPNVTGRDARAATRRGRRGGPWSAVGVVLLALAGPWIAPYPPERQEDVAGARLLPPLTRAHALSAGPHRTLIVTRLRRTPDGWQFDRAGRRQALAASDRAEEPAPRFYLLGTDTLGRDLLSRLLYGARHTVGLAALCVALALVVGIGTGASAGLAGGIWDEVVMRGVDVLMSIPRLLVVLVCASLFGPSIPLLVLVLGGTTWTGLARLARAETLAFRESGLAHAARAAGASAPRLVLRHLVPQIAPLLVVFAALRFADTIVLESALSFLGLGVPPPAVSLGDVLASGREALHEAWWVSAAPGLLIAAIVLSVRSTARGLFRLQDPPSLA
jgi:peptide/nickel transport system permease protein